MGSSSSKTSAAAASAGAGAGAVVRKNRSMEGTRGVLSSSCLGRCRSHNNYNNHHVLAQVVSKEENRTITLDDEQEQDSHQVLKRQQQSCRRNDGNHHDNDKNNDNDDVKVDYKISSLEDDQSPSTQSRSCFRLIPANLSFRLSRAASFTSSSPPSPSPTPFPLFSNSTTSTTVLATPPNAQPAIPSCDHSVITNQGCELPPPSATVAAHHSPASQYLHLFSSDSTALRLDRATSSTLSPCPHNDNIVSNHYDHAPIVNTDNTAMILPHHTFSNHHTDTTFIHSTRVNTRIGARQPVERSVRFSRTLSVGRLRDRVLRRSSLTDGLFGHLQHNRDMGNSSQDDGRQVPDGNPDISPPSPTHPLPRLSNSNNSQDDELDTSRPRDVRYHDIMQHRTDFLERRRRIRSQVRALQRLGSRFENLSGHERSCILAGQHRSGHCTCQMSSRARNPNNDTSARASISRIVMLAEALFEVLDEIHQQSVVLSSRPSVSSLGSIPAPTEVVESMPVKIYTRLQKHQHEDVTQCYICLVEYEEGDSMRILPCHHDFHRTCIDKWLKEIHRVCPLCRGDVCRSRSLPSEN